MDHPAQLRICHEHIAGSVRVHDGREEPDEQWCSLQDVTWCLDCERYVCAIHLSAKHDGHRTQPE